MRQYDLPQLLFCLYKFLHRRMNNIVCPVFLYSIEHFNMSYFDIILMITTHVLEGASEF